MGERAGPRRRRDRLRLQHRAGLRRHRLSRRLQLAADAVRHPDRRRARPEEHQAAELHPVQSGHALQLPARQPGEEDPDLRPRRRSARQSEQGCRRAEGDAPARRSTTCRIRATRRSLRSCRRRRTARCTASMPTTATSMSAAQFSDRAQSRGLADHRLRQSGSRRRRSAPGTSPGRRRASSTARSTATAPTASRRSSSATRSSIYNDRVYAAWRDAGMVILDVKDRTKPKLLATYDYNPPFHGGNLGAAHTSVPVVTRRASIPTSSCTPTRSSTARPASGASSTCPT